MEMEGGVGSELTHPHLHTTLGKMALRASVGFLGIGRSVSRRLAKLIVSHYYSASKERLWGQNLKPCHVHDSKHWEWVGLWWALACTMAVILELEKIGKLPYKAIGQMFLHSHYEIFRSTGARRPFDEKPSRPGSWVSTLLNL